MSTTIDEKVVEMRFDNKHFEKNVETSMSTLDKLKHSLRLDGASKGLSDLSDASGKAGKSFEKLEHNAYQAGFHLSDVWYKMFSVAEWKMARTLVDGVAQGVKNLANNLLGLPSIKAGFSEYETQINAVQTILANTESKGTTLDDVNQALDELNTYADKTIYNFTEMTRNIGTFTAAGVDLDTSVNAIQGIANLAAVSGSTSQQASTAMYQLSQAMASGTVKLMDWNSVVNAGMGGQVFQDALKDTARVHGIAIDDIIKKQGSFRESLSEGWLTTEILTDTLSKFTMAAEEGSDEWNAYLETLKKQGYTEEQAKNILKMANTATDAATKVKTLSQLYDTLKEAAQSGWTQTWEILVGDFEEAKELFSEISDVIGGFIGKSAESRNTMLENWKVLGGRTLVIDSLWNSFDAVCNIMRAVSEAFREIFPPTTSEQLLSFTEKIKSLSEKFLASTERNFDNLKRTFKGLFAILDIGKQLLSAIFGALKPLAGATGTLGSGILGVTAATGDWLVALSNAIRESGIFLTIANGIAKVLVGVISGIKTLVKWINEVAVTPALETLDSFLSGFRKGMGDVSDEAKNMKDGVTNSVDSIGEALANCAVVKIVKFLWSGLKTVAGLIAHVFGTLFGGFFSRIKNADYSGLIDLINAISVGAVLIGIKKLVGAFNDLLDVGNDFKSRFFGIADSFTEILDNIGNAIKSFTLKIQSEALYNIAKAIALLTASIVVLTLLDKEKVGEALGAITVLMAEIAVIMAIMSKANGGTKIGKSFKGIQINIGNMSMSMVAIATSLLIIASACAKLSKFSWGELARGVSASIVLLLSLALAAKIMSSKYTKTTGKSIQGGIQLVLLAAALLLVGEACKRFTAMTWEELGRGVSASLVLLAALVTAGKFLTTKTTKTTSQAVKGAGQLVILSLALLIVGEAVKQIGMLDWASWGRGLIAVSLVLLEMAGITKLLTTKTTKTTSTAIKGAMQLVAVSSALLIVAASMRIIGGMDWESWKRSIIAMGGALVALTVVVLIISKFGSGAMSGATAMITIAGSLLVLAVSLAIVGSLNMGAVAAGFVVLATAITLLGVAAYFLIPVAAGLVAIGVTIKDVGIGMLAFGAALLLVGMALPLIATGITAVALALATSVPLLVVGLKGLISLIPYFWEQMGRGLVAFISALADGMGAIAEFLRSVVSLVCDILIEHTPKLIETLFELVVSVLKSFTTYIPMIVGYVYDLLIGIITKIGEKVPDLVKAGVNIVMAVLKGVVEALSEMDTESLLQGILAIGLIAGLIAALAAIVGMIPMALVGVLGMGVVVSELALVLAAVGQLTKIPGLIDAIGNGGALLQAVGSAIGQFIGGLAGGIMAGGMLAVAASLPIIGAYLSLFMKNLDGFITGAKAIDESVVSGVMSLVGIILAITAVDILQGITFWFTGGNSVAKFGQELVLLGGALKNFAGSVSGIGGSKDVEVAIEVAKAISELTTHIPNTSGVVQWIAGEKSLAKFGSQLMALGVGICGFAWAVSGINVNNAKGAAQVAAEIAGITNNIPNSGGVLGWLTGESSIACFGLELAALGAGLAGFAWAVSGINGDSAKAAAQVAVEIAGIMNNIPNSGGVLGWLTGDKSISKFGGELAALGAGLLGFSVATQGISVETVTAAADAAKTLSEMSATVPSNTNKLSKFGDNLKEFGTKVKEYFKITKDITSSSTSGSTKLVSEIKSISDINYENIKNTTSAIKDFNKVVSKIGKDVNEDLKTAGKEAIEGYANGMEKGLSTAETACKTCVTKCADAIESKVGEFEDAGGNLVKGFANGISSNTWRAEAQSRAMAAAAARAAKKELDEHSPSKVGYEIGDFFGIAFVNAIGDYEDKAYSASEDMASSAKNGLRNAISKIKDYLNGDFDAQPTIRPVLDLSDVRAGAGNISRYLNLGQTVGVSANVNAINSSMVKSGQNGGNQDVVSEIVKLRKEMANMEHVTYSINGITYDDESVVADALKTIVRAATIERRA